MKKIDNTITICLSFGLLFGSLIATILIDTDYFVLTIIFAIVFSFFYVTHGNNKKSI